MNKIKLHLPLIVLLIMVNALLFPRTVSASKSGETFEAEVNGYHVSLSFTSEIKAGESDHDVTQRSAGWS